MTIKSLLFAFLWGLILLAVGLVAALWAPAPLPTLEAGTVLHGVTLIEPGSGSTVTRGGPNKFFH